MTMKMVDYQKEEHFRELIKALGENKTLRYLDISKASLPYDASDETCEALKLMFAHNDTLEELDISGEHAHLEVAKFGIGLNHALTGLTKNRALKVLRIECELLLLRLSAAVLMNSRSKARPPRREHALFGPRTEQLSDRDLLRT
jgi:hypothetical protein